jgi:hypothetical protein
LPVSRTSFLPPQSISFLKTLNIVSSFHPTPETSRIGWFEPGPPVVLDPACKQASSRTG